MMPKRMESVTGTAPESYAALFATRTSTYQTVMLSSKSPCVVVPGTFDTAGLWRGFRLPDRLDGRSVLDVGCCAGGYLIEALHRGARLCVGIDLDVAALAWAARATAYATARASFAGGAEFLHGDAFVDLDPRGPRQFDLVLCLSLLHHIADPLHALTVLRRWVADGGSAVIEMETWTENSPMRGGVQAQTVEEWREGQAVSGAIFGRGVYPTADCVIAALNAVGFDVERLGCVRQWEAIMHRDAFRCTTA